MMVTVATWTTASASTTRASARQGMQEPPHVNSVSELYVDEKELN